MEIRKDYMKILREIDSNLIKYGIEIWKPVAGYSNYVVSNMGRVKNITTSKVLKNKLNSRGYCQVNLYKNNKGTNIRIHNLVANAFIPNFMNKPFADHIDNDKLNNNVSNLRWCTQKENCQNRSMRNDNTSGTKGVSWHKQHKKWQANIMVNGKRNF